MPAIIEICNLRNIERLRFIIPDRGVSLLTAGNGAGKTSLLACLRRIGYPNAFPVHFPSSLKSARLDNHSNGTVTYHINGEEVEYAYRGARWTPRPRRNSSLFDKLGYSEVAYIGATADRITPRPEDFEPHLVRAAPKAIVDGANLIFDTSKFGMLRTINLARGVGNEAFVLAIAGTPLTYHSEQHFSLGELCVLKLLRLLKDVNNNSMIIIDELEMALHPRAQVKLLSYLEDQARLKHLTIIFSTHSVTLLKTIHRSQIIYLERSDDGETRPIYCCYPTYAIGNIASDEEALPDVLLYVEDVLARDVLTAFFERFADDKFPDPNQRPSAKIIPIGGFDQVVSFLERNRSVLPPQVKQKAVLDEDVSSETLAAWRAADNFSRLAKFRSQQQDISFLPFTPEVGILNYISSNLAAVEAESRRRFADNQIRIAPHIAKFQSGLAGAQLRRSAKEAFQDLSSYLQSRTQRTPEAIQEQLCNIFAGLSWTENKEAFMRLLGPLM